MKKNNVLKHFFIIGSGTAINMIIGLITTPIITRIVDPTEYGQLSIFTMYAEIAVMVLCLGLDQALVRYYYSCKNLEHKKKLLRQCVIMPVVVCLICSALVILNSIYSFWKFEFDTLITVLLCTYTLIQIIYRFSIVVIRLEYNSKLYSKLQILLKIIYVTLALLLIYVIRKDYLLQLCIATVMSAFICMIISIKAQWKLWNPFYNRQEAGVVSFKDLVKYAYPFIFSMGITTFFQAIDKISLNYYCNYSEVGIYSSAMSIVHIFAIIQTTFNSLWGPMAIEHYTKNPNDKKFYQKGNAIITIIMYFIGINLIMYKDIVVYFLGDKYREAAYILPLLIFNPIMYTISETTVSGLVFMKKSKMQVVVAIGACISNIIGNVILVPKFGTVGAAISTGLAYIVFFTLRTVLSNKYFYVDFKLKRFYLLTLVVLLYAMYNAFVKFNFYTLVGYIICIITMIWLYRKEINKYIGEGIDIVKGKNK